MDPHIIVFTDFSPVVIGDINKAQILIGIATHLLDSGNDAVLRGDGNLYLFRVSLADNNQMVLFIGNPVNPILPEDGSMHLHYPDCDAKYIIQTEETEEENFNPFG